jgi:hypothetical protein
LHRKWTNIKIFASSKAKMRRNECYSICNAHIVQYENRGKK